MCGGVKEGKDVSDNVTDKRQLLTYLSQIDASSETLRVYSHFDLHIFHIKQSPLFTTPTPTPIAITTRRCGRNCTGFLYQQPSVLYLYQSMTLSQHIHMIHKLGTTLYDSLHSDGCQRWIVGIGFLIG